MARGRMISKSLSTSEKFAALVPTAGALAEFCQALYPLIVVHTDDFGRLQGDPFTVKHVCFPSSPRSLDDFGTALQYLHHVHLTVWYLVGGKRFIQIEQFDVHQSGLHKRTRSAFPRVPGTSGKDPELPESVPQNEANFREIPGQEKRREGKRTKEKYPPTPLAGGRVTRAELKEAKTIRDRAYGRCPHEPKCATADACLRGIALSRRAKQRAS